MTQKGRYMIITNQLTASQSAQVAVLEAVCKKNDPLQGNIFLSDELNFDSEFPCFYLLYNPDDNEELISFLSVFAPSEMEAEIYAYTAPAWRRQGCFNTLLEAALHTLYEYGIDDIYFVHEPSSKSARAVLAGLDTVYRHSECLMKYESEHAPTTPGSVSSALHVKTCTGLQLMPADSSDMPAITRLHSEAFKSDIDASHELICEVFADKHCQARKLVTLTCENTGPLAICFYTVCPQEISVFGVAVEPAHQRKGYASLMLEMLLYELSDLYPGIPINLQVNNTNHAAYALYQKLGFTIRVQFDYDYANCGELLALF